MPHLRPSRRRHEPLGARVYTDACLGPKDMDVWMLYDGFSFLAMMWMEQLGLVEPGSRAPMSRRGADPLRRRAPVNTHGGQLSEGRLHATGTSWKPSSRCAAQLVHAKPCGRTTPS